MEYGEPVCIGGPGRLYNSGLAHCGFSASFVSSLTCLGISALVLISASLLPLEENDKTNMVKWGLITGGLGLTSCISAGLTFFCCTKKTHQENERALGLQKLIV